MFVCVYSSYFVHGPNRQALASAVRLFSWLFKSTATISTSSGILSTNLPLKRDKYGQLGLAIPSAIGRIFVAGYRT